MKAATRACTMTIAPTLFQSTPPVKAATIKLIIVRHNFTISIHAAREGGDVRKAKQHITRAISIHAAREGGDVKICRNTVRNSISIHAAREGGDHSNGTHGTFSRYFNPRRP